MARRMISAVAGVAVVDSRSVTARLTVERPGVGVPEVVAVSVSSDRAAALLVTAPEA